VRKLEAGGVQELALERQVVLDAVEGVARDRELDRGEVDANLVRPARLEANAEERAGRQELEHLEVRDRVARRCGIERVASGVGAVASDRSLDAPAPGAWRPDNEGEIPPLEAATTDEVLQAAVRLGTPRDDDQPGGVAIEAVDDAGTVDRTARDSAREQALDERPASQAWRRMDDNPGRLVDDEQVLVLVGDAKAQLLRLERFRADRAAVELDRLAARKPKALGAVAAVDAHGAPREETLGLGARSDLGQRGQEAVEALAGGLVRNRAAERRFGRAGAPTPAPR
jgi:hypothetical protein